MNSDRKGRRWGKWEPTPKDSKIVKLSGRKAAEWQLGFEIAVPKRVGNPEDTAAFCLLAEVIRNAVESNAGLQAELDKAGIKILGFIAEKA